MMIEYDCSGNQLCEHCCWQLAGPDNCFVKWISDFTYIAVEVGRPVLIGLGTFFMAVCLAIVFIFPSLIKKRDAEEERTFEDERKRQRLADEEQLKRDLEDESDRVLDLGERLRDEFCELVPEDGDSEPAGSFGVLYERANVHHGLKAELEGLAFGVQSGQIDWKIAQDELAVIEEKVASVQSVNEHRQSQLYRYGKDLAFVCDELARVRDRLSMPGLTERAKDLLKDDEHYLLRSKGDIEHAIAGLRD